MNDTAPTLGSITSSDAEKRILARKSREFNLKVRFSLLVLAVVFAFFWKLLFFFCFRILALSCYLGSSILRTV